MILRVKFYKKNYLKYISHLDLLRLFQRSFNRADIPINYSQGFNPHPKFSIANPLALGMESEEEYMDIELDYMPEEEFIEKMNMILPKDVQIIKAEYIENEESVAALIAWAFYEIKFNLFDNISKENLQDIFNTWLSQDEIMITKIKKKGKKTTEKEQNIKSLIGNVVIKDINNNHVLLEVLLKSGSNGNLKPTDFMELFVRDNPIEIDMDSITIKRLALYAEKNNNIYKPL